MRPLYARDFLHVALLVQLVTLVSLFLDLPILRQVIGFVYLTFIPGFLILRILKVDSASLVENLLLSAGLSIASLMFTGLVLNTLGLALGIPKPLALPTIIISVTCVSLMLFVLAYKGSSEHSKGIVNGFSFSPAIPVLVCIPLIAIIGAEMVNIWDVNIVLLFLVVVICVVLACSFSKRIVPRKAFPLVVLVISLSLLFQTAFSSNFLVGWDIHVEYYFANLTIVNGMWDRTNSHPYNGMLSVTILPAVYLDFLNVDLNWVLKLVYPLIFSLVPLILYLAYRKQTTPVIALLSVFFFVATETFYVEMLGLGRQIIAELFLALIVLVIVERSISFWKRRLLLIVFSVALIVSHYSASYIFLFFLILALLLSRFFKSIDGEHLRVISGRVLLVNLIIVILWSVFVSPILAEGFISGATSAYDGLFGLNVRTGLEKAVPGFTSPLHQVGKYLALVLQFFVFLGLLGQIVKRRKIQFHSEYFSMSIASALIFVFAVLVPSFASKLNMSRFTHLALFCLAPFSVLGMFAFLGAATRSLSSVFRLKRRFSHDFRKLGLFLFYILLVSYLLFQTGFIYEISEDVPTSISLSRDHMYKWPSYLHSLYVDGRGFASALWLSKFADNQSIIFAEFGNFQINSYGSIPPEPSSFYNFYPETLYTYHGSSYIYFGRQHIIHDGVLQRTRVLNATEFSVITSSRNKVFDDAGSEVFYKRFP